jgi:hypothetical protein
MKMKKEEFVGAMLEISDMIRDFRADNGKLKELFGCDSDAENVFLGHFYKAADLAINHLETVNDCDGWISYYIYDRPKGGGLAKVNGKDYHLTNTGQLWDMLVEIWE